MVQGISGATQQSRLFARLRYDSQQSAAGTGDDAAAQAPSRSLTAPNLAPQQLRLDDPGTQLSTAFSERLALRVRSQSRLKIDDDGSLRQTNKTNLRFRYDLETEDGQRIQLRARAKIKQSLSLDENGDVAIKTRVKFQFRLIQEDISDGLAPLLGNDSDADSLQRFAGIVDDTVGQFSEQGSIDADQLIGSVLEAFNDLFQELSGGLGIAGQTVQPEGDVIDSEAVNRTPEPAAAPLPAPNESAEIALAQSQELIAENSAAVEASNQIEQATAADELDEADESGEVKPQQEVEDADAAQESDEVPAAPVDLPPSEQIADDVAESRREILANIRIRFVQSFSQVIQGLTPGEDSGQGAVLL